MPKAKTSASELTVQDIAAYLKANPAARKQVVKILARDHPKDYLASVKIDTTSIRDTAARFMSSAKEWQE